MSPRDLASLHVLGEPGMEITVRDAALEPVAMGVAELRAELAPGLYQIDFDAGRTTNDEIVRLTADGLVVHAPEAELPSPVPTARSTLGHDPVADAACALSRRPSERLGSGAQLLVVASDPLRVATANPLTGVTLRDEDGRLIADLAALSRRSARGELPRWAIACLEVDPGPARLRVSLGTTTIEQAIWLMDDWQTQVFLSRRSWGPSGARRRVSLPDAAILMSRSYDGFDPQRHDMRLTEIARLALADDRPAIREEDLEGLVYGKFANPMLGLFGAQLLLRRRTPGDEELLRTMARNLGRLLGEEQPDVCALRLALLGDAGPVSSPPLLRASWDAIVAASARDPSLVAADSPAGRIADRLFGSGPLLTWRPPDARTRRRRPATRHAIAEDVAELGRLLTDTPASGTEALTSAGQGVLLLAEEYSRGIEPSRHLRARDLDDGAVVDALGLPPSVVASAVDEALGHMRRDRR